MKAAIYVLCGVVGGVAGALVTNLTREEPTTRTVREAAPPARIDEEALMRRILERIEPRLSDRDARDEFETPEPGVRPSADANPGAAVEAPRAGSGGGPEATDFDDFFATLKAEGFRSAMVDRMWQWMSTTKNMKRIPDLVKAIHGEIKRDPENADLRVALATAYVGELNFNTPSGARQGLVWGQAAAAYDAAIKLEPQHWQARYGKAFGTTFIPEQFGQRPAAIRQFEELRKIQAGRAPEPRFVQTYIQLGRLYKDEGNLEKARAVWEQGIKLFPDNKPLKEQLEVSTKR